LPQANTRTALEELYDCIQELAAHASNPVLEVLRGVTPVEQETKYPANGLIFAQQGVRAFYHCHDSVNPTASEHGHFHVFLCEDTRATTPAWAHLAALAMDGYGQPSHWFSVNRWVTGGQWLPADMLARLLEFVSLKAEMLLVERWLIAMLRVCHDQLEQLLIQRDEYLTRLLSTSSENEEVIWQDKRYYELSRLPVDLLALFQKHNNTTI